ncbi:hypothetical protein [Flavobacterium foetidum]|uniref:hypothetical protein n=1 Tax=Flavobacterium foetidum TaxID=2026681 RepID=UPI00107555F6|nr:hypothetical protein [Flavobacterium foetidum]KAF2517203.1 hypothetical protein E0W73_03645 [Flavobacterium foetidum]
MKKIFFIVLIVLVSCKSKQEILSAQQEKTKSSKYNNPNYEPLHKFEGDTLKYLQTNFLLTNKDFYKGKPLSVLLNDLEIDVKAYSGSSGWNINFNKSISLNFYSKLQKKNKIKEKKNPLVLIIYWEVEIPQQKVVELLRKNDGRWTEEEKEYYGQHIIKDIEMVVPNY